MDRNGLLATVSTGGVALLAVAAGLSLLAGTAARPWLAVGFAAVGVVVLVCLYGAVRAGRIRTPYW